MTLNSIMDSIRAFFGKQENPPKNDFRNPIWISDDEDDGDELYSRQQQMEVFEDNLDLREFRKQMHDMFKNLGSMFGEFRSLFHEDNIDAFTSMSFPEDNELNQYSGRNIRDYYLKPGHHGQKPLNEDRDLDGKISSNEISDLLTHKKDSHSAGPSFPFNGNLVPGRSFCKTVITTSITKPDGTVETRRIIKNGNEVIEETTTTGPGTRGPHSPGLDQISGPGSIYDTVLTELASFFSNYH